MGTFVLNLGSPEGLTREKFFHFIFKMSVMIWLMERSNSLVLGHCPAPEAYQIPPNLQGSLVPLPRTSPLRTSFYLSPSSLNVYIYFITTQLST